MPALFVSVLAANLISAAAPIPVHFLPSCRASLVAPDRRRCGRPALVVVVPPVVALPLVVTPLSVVVVRPGPAPAPVLVLELLPESALSVLAPAPRFASVRLSRRAGPRAPEVP
jgi:hypothetical protein